MSCKIRDDTFAWGIRTDRIAFIFRYLLQNFYLLQNVAAVAKWGVDWQQQCSEAAPAN